MQQGEILLPIFLSFLAGLSTAVGGLIVLSLKRFEQRYLAFGLGLSAGVMIYISFAELLASAVVEEGFLSANLAFFGGMLFIMVVDFFVPHEYIAERVCSGSPFMECKGRGKGFGARRGFGRHRRMAIAGAFTAIGIAIHNLPEGLSVFLGGVSDISLGLSLAIAISLHNIPEGIAIAMPIYHSTKSRAKALFYTIAAGVAEPIGAVFGALFLLPFLAPGLLSLSLAFVGGIMVFISFDELLPLCFQNGAGKGHASIAGLILGMILMAASLHLL